MPSVFGVDLAKQVFQVHTVDQTTGEIKRWTLSRSKLAEFFSNAAPAIIAMEACGSSHQWARRF
jgi:transposase